MAGEGPFQRIGKADTPNPQYTQQEIDAYSLRAEQVRERIRLRISVLKHTYFALIGWLVFIAALITGTGLNKLDIEMPVLLALIGGTSLNIFSIMVAVFHHLFSKR